MKKRFNIVCSMVELIIGLSSVLSFIILLINGENMIKWILPLLLAFILLVKGIIEIIDYKKQK